MSIGCVYGVPYRLSGERHGVKDIATKQLRVKQIERAITQLPAEELAELVSWLEDYHAQVWDNQIAEDLEAGRLDALLAEVEEECEAQALMETELDARMAELIRSLAGRPAADDLTGADIVSEVNAVGEQRRP